jgi:hypothetical protein
MTVIELHVHNSGSPICIPAEAITQVGCLGEDNHAEIKRMDGGSVEVKETYQQVAALLQGIKSE